MYSSYVLGASALRISRPGFREYLPTAWGPVYGNLKTKTKEYVNYVSYLYSSDCKKKGGVHIITEQEKRQMCPASSPNINIRWSSNYISAQHYPSPQQCINLT